MLSRGQVICTCRCPAQADEHNDGCSCACAECVEGTSSDSESSTGLQHGAVEEEFENVYLIDGERASE